MSRLSEIFSTVSVPGFPESLSPVARAHIEGMPNRPLPLPLASNNSWIDLNGTWKVKRWPFGIDEAAAVAGQDDSASWEGVTQPGKVLYQAPEDQPFKNPAWNRVTMAHLDENDGAILIREVRIPESWRDSRIIWHCDGVYPAGRFYVDGRRVGEHLSGLTAAQYDISELVRPGTMVLLAIRLLRRYHASHIDMPRHSLEFAGLTRNTALYALPQCHATEVFLPAKVDLSSGQGTVAGRVAVSNTGVRPLAVSLRCTLTALDGSGQIALWESPLVTVAPSQTTTVIPQLDAGTVRLWSDECPHLYKMVTELMSPDQASVRYEQRLAFRRLNIRGDRPFLNGNPVKFRGVNHVTFHPDHGMYTPLEWLRTNFALMKDANVNCIRTHYAAQPDVLDLADEMGFYLLQEIPIDWWGDYVDKPEYLHCILHRIEGVVIRDRHHPCLMGFCMGNENFPTSADSVKTFTQHYALYREYVHALAPDALVLVPPPGPANRLPGHFEPRFGDIADVHYKIESVKEYHRSGAVELYRCWGGPTDKFTREQLTAMGWSGVWFSSEYGLFNNLPDLLRAPYCSVIADKPEDWLSGKTTMQAWVERMEQDWDYMYDDPTCLGGAYFSWLAPSSGPHFGWSLLAEDADWGLVTSELLPKPSFWALRVLFSPVRFPRRLSVGAGDDSVSFTVFNHFTSIDLAECILRTQMGPTQRDLGIVREWRDIPVKCEPGKKCTITLPLWHEGARQSLREGRVSLIRCHLIKPDGFRVVTADILLVPATGATNSGSSEIAIGPDAVMG